MVDKTPLYQSNWNEGGSATGRVNSLPLSLPVATLSRLKRLLNIRRMSALFWMGMGATGAKGQGDDLVPRADGDGAVAWIFTVFLQTVASVVAMIGEMDLRWLGWQLVCGWGWLAEQVGLDGWTLAVVLVTMVLVHWIVKNPMTRENKMYLFRMMGTTATIIVLSVFYFAMRACQLYGPSVHQALIRAGFMIQARGEIIWWIVVSMFAMMMGFDQCRWLWFMIFVTMAALGAAAEDAHSEVVDFDSHHERLSYIIMMLAVIGLGTVLNWVKM